MFIIRLFLRVPGEAIPVWIVQMGFAQEPAPVASGGVALPNGWNLLFGEASRTDCDPWETGSQEVSLYWVNAAMREVSHG